MKAPGVAAALLAIPIIACASSKATINSFTDPSYSAQDVESIAVLPIRNARLAPSEAQSVTRRVSQAIHGKAPKIRLMGPTESVQALNDHDLAHDWATFVEDYVKSGVPDAEALGRIGKALNVDALVQGELLNVQQEDGEFGGNKGQTRVTVRFTMLGTRDGTLLWEASSDGIKKTATTLSDAPAIIEAVNLAVNKILDNLPPLRE